MKSFFVFIILLASFTSIVAGSSYSGTIPVLFINTDGNEPVLRKDTTLKATFYLESFEWKGYQSVGTSVKPLTCEIKCRGNWTFTDFEKKPYKIKLAEKAELLGMPPNKHWVLLAHADDRTGFLRNSIGFEVARMLGMKYSPRERPIELVLNGEYMGLYMLTEHVRVGKYRVDIVEQENGETDDDKIKKGGWLVEIDNYEREGQIKITVPSTQIESLNFTYHSPDSLSANQVVYLKNQLSDILKQIFDEDKSQSLWSNEVDVDELVKYCINTEVTSHEEAFFGSTFMYKPNGEDKWLFGPVWDFGNSILSCWKKSFTWDSDKNKYGYNIMTEIAKFSDFTDKVSEKWGGFYENAYQLENFIDSIVADISIASEHDAERWPQYVYEDYGSSVYKKSIWVKDILRDRINWLNSQWGGQVSSGLSPKRLEQHYYSNSIYSLSGQKSYSSKKSIKIIKGKKYVNK